MDRIKMLSRIRGPYLSERKDFEWVFYADRKLSHRLNTVTGRKFYLRYIHDLRTFQIVDATRRVSKRDKRHTVKVAFRMGTYLQSRLPPEQIARCIAVSLRLKEMEDQTAIGFYFTDTNSWSHADLGDLKFKIPYAGRHSI